MKRARYLTAACLTGLMVSVFRASAAPPDQVYEFTVSADTLQIPPVFCTPDGTPPCAYEPALVPYKLATLTLTHDALTKHQAQASDMTNPITDDHRIVKLTFPTLPGSGGGEATFYLSIPVSDPLCPGGYPDRLFEVTVIAPGSPQV